MCYRKKEVRNPVKDDHRSGFDKVRLKVACCKCPSCRNVKSNDWLVRSYYEFLGNNSQAFFVTLDFDNDHLPHYNGIPCWDSDVMKHFLYRLRYYVGKFRYMYATDYGGFLRRPHYHMIVMVYNRMTDESFFSAVNSCWKCGSYGNIQKLKSVEGSHIAAVEYVCGYVNKDIAFNPDDDTYRDMPMRFRPRVQASKGYGLRALEEGLITPQQLLSGTKVNLPVGSDGRIVSLPVPRYYEMKLAYDYHYNPEDRSVELTKNDFGVELSKVRHNRCYVYYIRQFFSSRHEVSELLGTDWYQRVIECLSDIDDFSEFVYYRDFIVHFGKSVVDNIRNEWLYRPRWRYYEESAQLYDAYKKSVDLVKCDKEVQLLIENAKARCRKELSENPRKYYYLKTKGFDFSSIYN